MKGVAAGIELDNGKLEADTAGASHGSRPCEGKAGRRGEEARPGSWGAKGSVAGMAAEDTLSVLEKAELGPCWQSLCLLKNILAFAGLLATRSH